MACRTFLPALIPSIIRPTPCAVLRRVWGQLSAGSKITERGPTGSITPPPVPRFFLAIPSKAQLSSPRHVGVRSDNLGLEMPLLSVFSPEETGGLGFWCDQKKCKLPPSGHMGSGAPPASIQTSTGLTDENPETLGIHTRWAFAPVGGRLLKPAGGGVGNVDQEGNIQRRWCSARSQCGMTDTLEPRWGGFDHSFDVFKMPESSSNML